MPKTALDRILSSSKGLRGRIRLPPDAAHPAGRVLIVQGALELNANAHDAGGAPLLVVEYVPPTDARSAGQLSQRERMRAANAAWRAMSPAERKQYEPEANRRRITPYNQAMSILCKRPISPGAGWDGGLSQWDNGLSRWDYSATVWDDGATAWDDESTFWDN